MKTVSLLISLILLSRVAAAADAAPTPSQQLAEHAIHEFIGDCPGEMKLTHKSYDQKLPQGFRASRVEVESDTSYCGGSYAVITAPSEDYYVGNPWSLDDYEGTIEQKLKKFTWEKLHDNFEPIVHREQKNNGLFRVELLQSTEAGKIPLTGYADPEGTIFFLGNFISHNSSSAAQRIAQVAPIVAIAPSRGPANAKVTLYEFSDFECPSCRAAATFLKPILEKYGNQIRYVRIDLPLVSAHPWAFSAALMGRAIFRQSPAAFWEYKEAIYANQDKLNAFALEDFVHGFVADHDLDAKRFEKDIASDALRNEIIQSISTSYAVPVLGTPTYLVDGELVATGSGGDYLASYLAKKLAR